MNQGEQRRRHHLIQLPEKHQKILIFFLYKNWGPLLSLDQNLKYSFKRSQLKWKPILTLLSLSFFSFGHHKHVFKNNIKQIQDLKWTLPSPSSVTSHSPSLSFNVFILNRRLDVRSCESFQLVLPFNNSSLTFKNHTAETKSITEKKKLMEETNSAEDWEALM